MEVFHMTETESSFDQSLFKQISTERPRSNPQQEIQADTANAMRGIKPTYNKQMQDSSPVVNPYPPQQNPQFHENVMRSNPNSPRFR
jgi:hypothetical protein